MCLTTDGKGAYFALTANYSNNYANRGSDGLKRIIVARVLPGETSQGRDQQLVPDVRISAQNVLFDSTTDQLSCPEPSDNDPSKRGVGVRQMYVCFHDAQAYPEYLITYRDG